MKELKCPWSNKCRNGVDGCYHSNPEKCVRFLPLIGTHLTHLEFTVETPPHIDSNAFADMFMNWLDCMGWSGAGGTKPVESEDNKQA